ncbi:MAG: hypothetical protein LBP80_03730 [Treponema sp.]|jgi:hypothetical protein|nr:hypothetical protein [Treponema sp.]
MDENLYWKTYAGLKVDLAVNKGLLYISSDSRKVQYDNTVKILQALYTAKRNDGITNDSNHVSGSTFKVLDASSSAATDAIWNHINNYRQPVVVVIDSNIRDYVQSYGVAPASRSPPTLHYVVVYGIKNTGGTRIFTFYDPAGYGNGTSRNYDDRQLSALMLMPSNSPAWVYQYPASDLNRPYPAYILLVQGD